MNKKIVYLIVSMVFTAVVFISGFTLHSIVDSRSDLEFTMEDLENAKAIASDKLVMEGLKRVSRGSHFSGAVLVRRYGKIKGIFYHGYKDKKNNEKVDKNTIFPICSQSKVFCGVVIAQLIREKKLSYDERLSKYLPEVNGSNEVTIRELLTHTSQYTNPEEAPTSYLSTPEKVLKFTQSITEYRQNPGFNYSNSNFVFLAMIAEKIENKKYSKILRDRIFTVLGMKHTFSPGEITKKQLPVSYAVIGTEEYQKEETNYSLNLLSSLIGAGELCSTVVDLDKFFEGLSKGKLLSREEYKNLFFSDSGTGYSAGISVKEENKGYISSLGSFNGEGIKSYFEGSDNGENSSIILSNMHSISVEQLGDLFFSMTVEN